MRRLLLWGPVAAFMIFTLSLPGAAMRPAHELLWDKALHFLAYVVFGGLCLRAFHGGFRETRLPAVAAGLALAVGFGWFDELQQALRPHRFASVQDALADTLGALAALPLFALAVFVVGRFGAREV